MYPATILQQSGGLTFRDVMAGVPHDASAIIVLALVVGAVFLIWHGSRKSTIQKYGGSPPDAATGASERTEASGESVRG